MKRLLLLTLTWCVVSLAIAGWVGERLAQEWQARVEDDFRRSVNAVLQIVEAIDWPNPPESDPRWKAMEQQLGLAVVPTEASDFDVQGAGTFADHAEQITSEKFEWRPGPGGEQRLSVRLRMQYDSPELRTLVVTREVPRPVSTATWWWGWGIMNAAAGIALVLAFRSMREHALERQQQFSPWLAAMQTEPLGAEGVLLPAVGGDAELGMAMSIVGEKVNGLHAQLKGAQDRSELVFRNLKEGVLAVDQHGAVLLANKALRSLFGISNESYLYRSLLEVLRVPKLTELIDSVLKDQASREAEMEYGNPPRHLRIQARPLPMGDGKHGVLLTARDESLVKRVELIRREFVANASHELRTPLAAIRAYAETLQRGALDDRAAAERFVGSMIDQADRIDSLVQGMLQLSRAEVGTALKSELFDAVQATNPCVAANAAVAQAKGVQLNCTLPEHPIVIRSDRDAFQTIVNNLLSNGVRYSNAGANVDLRLWLDGGALHVEVKDTGIGMNEEDLERAFERFYRAEKDRSSSSGGTGLGLSMVKHLVQTLGGTVVASSKPNVGSTFRVQLPQHQTDA